MGDDSAAAASPPALDTLGSDEETRSSIDIERLVKAREDQLDEGTGLEHDPQHHLARSLSSFRGRGHHRRSIGGAGGFGVGRNQDASVNDASNYYVDDREAFANSGSIEIPLSLSLGIDTTDDASSADDDNASSDDDNASDGNKVKAAPSSGGKQNRPATLSVQSTKMFLAWKIPPKRGARWSASLSSQLYAKQKLGYASCTSRIGYDLLPSTQLYTEQNFGVHPFATVGTAVRLSQHSSIQLGGGSGGLTISGKRNLCKNRIGGTLALSVDSTRRFRVAQIGLTTLVDRLPTLSLYITLGINAAPVRLSIENERASASVGWRGLQRGLAFDGMFRRSLSNFASFGVGVRAVAGKGVAWLFQLERGEFVMKIPVTICPRLDAGSAIVMMYITFLSSVIDGVVGDIIGSSKAGISVHDGTAGGTKSNNISLLRLKKARADAERQVALMKGPARSKRKREEERNGLVIDKAIYYLDGGTRLDVTAQIQFWVTDSSLYLPSAPKSNLLGFYDISSADQSKSKMEPIALTSWKQVWQGFWFDAKAPVPILYISYTYQGKTFQLSVRDEDELKLPSPSGFREDVKL